MQPRLDHCCVMTGWDPPPRHCRIRRCRRGGRSEQARLKQQACLLKTNNSSPGISAANCHPHCASPESQQRCQGPVVGPRCTAACPALAGTLRDMGTIRLLGPWWRRCHYPMACRDQAQGKAGPHGLPDASGYSTATGLHRGRQRRRRLTWSRLRCGGILSQEGSCESSGDSLGGRLDGSS